MKTRPRHTRSNGNELSKATQNAKTTRAREILRISNITTTATKASKSKRTKKPETSESLPDQQPINEIYNKFRACHVRVKRLKWKTPNGAEKQVPKLTTEICTDEGSKTVSGSEILQEKSDISELQPSVSASRSLKTNYIKKQGQLPCRKTRHCNVKILNSAAPLNEPNTMEIGKRVNDSMTSKHVEKNPTAQATENNTKIKKLRCSKSRTQKASLILLESNCIEDPLVTAQINCFKPRPCCVKIRRLKPSVRSGIENISANIPKPSNLNSRSSLRNPALALTRRKTQENGLKKTSTTDGRKNSLANKRPTPLEPNRSSTMHASASVKMLSDISRDPLISNTKTTTLEGKNVNIERCSKEIKRAHKVSQNITITPENISKGSAKARGKLSKKHSYQTNTPENQDVYEFMSLSQNLDSEADKNKDPAADIIKKLIKQGKVVVTKNRKGKPIVIPRKRSRRPVTTKCTQTKQKIVTKQFKTQAFQPIRDIIPEEDGEDHFDIDFDIPNENGDVLRFVRPDVPKDSNKSVTRTSSSVNSPNPQSAFSSLARSVLIQETNKTTREINFDREIQKWVSTPQRKPQVSFVGDGVNLSPILRPTDNENVLQKNNDVSIRPNFSEVGPNISLPFSSNDSNAENMPPSVLAKANATESKDENASIFNTRQTLNPRRMLTNRSPLKTINIIEVITLPPYKKPSNKDIRDNDTLKKTQQSQTSVNDSEYEESNKNAEKLEALFGFEEYINYDASDLEEESINDITSSSSSNLRSQLKKLKKWCPKTPRYETAKCSTITKQIFDDDLVKKRGQLDIRNMLCSTMVNASSRKSENTTPLSLLNNSDSDSSENVATTSKGTDGLDLFGDPESTFNQEDLHRTYERPFKRKRKLQHQYSVFLDSEDESENEDKDDLNTSVNKKAKRQVHKRNQREESPNPELEKFVSEFNSMIKEAEDYELLVN